MKTIRKIFSYYFLFQIKKSLRSREIPYIAAKMEKGKIYGRPRDDPLPNISLGQLLLDKMREYGDRVFLVRTAITIVRLDTK